MAEDTLVTDDVNIDTNNDGDKTEKTPDDDKSEVKDPSPNTDSEDGKADKEVGAPEDYEDFTLPGDMELDKTKLEEFVPVAKELGLSQEKAQKLVSVYANWMDAQAKTNQETWNTTQESWRAAVKSDKELGGPAYEDSLTNARHAVKELGTPALIEALDMTGMGNHVEVVRILSKIGKMMKEDGMFSGKSNDTTPKDPAKILFPNQN